MLFANLVLITFVNSLFVKSTMNINPVHKLLQSISAKSIFLYDKYHTHPLHPKKISYPSHVIKHIYQGWVSCLCVMEWSNEQDKISCSYRTPVILVLRHTCKSPLENNKQYNDYITLLFNLKFIFSIYLVRWPIIYLQQNCF